jgi:hypothetical protein
MPTLEQAGACHWPGQTRDTTAAIPPSGCRRSFQNATSLPGCVLVKNAAAQRFPVPNLWIDVIASPTRFENKLIRLFLNEPELIGGPTRDRWRLGQPPVPLFCLAGSTFYFQIALTFIRRHPYPTGRYKFLSQCLSDTVARLHSIMVYYRMVFWGEPFQILCRAANNTLPFSCRLVG